MIVVSLSSNYWLGFVFLFFFFSYLFPGGIVVVVFDDISIWWHLLIGIKGNACHIKTNSVVRVIFRLL